MSVWETPAPGDDTPQATPASAAERAAAGDTCPTCGGAPGPGKIGRCAACIEEEWATIRTQMGEEWYRRHRYGGGD